MVANQTNKGSAFRRLHMQEGAFVIPNPWDIGTPASLHRWASKHWQQRARVWPSR